MAENKVSDTVVTLQAGLAAMVTAVGAIDSMIKTVSVVPTDKPTTVPSWVSAVVGASTGVEQQLVSKYTQEQDKALLQPVVKQVQTLAAGWPVTKQAIHAAAKKTVDSAGTVAALGENDPTVAVLILDMETFEKGTLKDIQACFATAKSALDKSNADGVALYQAGQKLIYDLAQKEIYAIGQEIHQLQAELEKGGENAQISAEIVQCKGQKAALEKTPVPTNGSDPNYKYASGVVTSTSTGLDAIATVNTSLVQVANKLRDLTTSTNPDLAVMKAFLLAFQTEFASAVAEAKTLTG
jgi:hypothetical protein